MEGIFVYCGMEHSDILQLIEPAVKGASGAWADFGSGDGVFTLALAELGGPNLEIYSIDEDYRRLNNQKRKFMEKFPEERMHFLHGDFTEHLPLPPLDGILMANSLHFIKKQEGFLSQVRNYLKPSGKVVVVEYDMRLGTPWVPYPVASSRFEELMLESGFKSPKLLAQARSTFNRKVYSGAAVK